MFQSRTRLLQKGNGLSGAAAAVAFCMLLLPTSALAHVISIQRASATLHPDRITIEWKADAEDLVHQYGLGRTPARPYSVESVRDVAPRHADRLRSQLIIRDANGEQLVGRSVSQTMEPDPESNPDPATLQLRYEFEYRLESPPRYLSFQKSPGDGDPHTPTQLHLDIRPVGGNRPELIRLTNGGNVETIRIKWPDEGRRQPASISPAQDLKCIAAKIDVSERGMRVVLEVPLPMLETFQSVQRVDRDFLESSEQLEAAPHLSAFLRSRNPIHINGRPAEPGEMTLEFLDAGSPAQQTDTAPARLGVWLTRVRVVQNYKCNTSPEDFELRWNLFNPAVLVAEATVTCLGQSSTHRISTYEPTLRWSRGPSDLAQRRSDSPPTTLKH